MSSTFYTSQPQQPCTLTQRWRAKRPHSIYLPDSLKPTDYAGVYHCESVASTVVVGMHEPGMTWNFGTGNKRIILPTTGIPGGGSTPTTWVVHLYCTSLAGIRTILASSNSQYLGPVWVILTTGAMALYIGGVGSMGSDSVNTLAINTWYTVAIRISSSGNDRTFTFAVNGVLGSTSTYNSSVWNVDAGVIGDSFGGSAPSYQGHMALVATFDTLFSDAEMCDITSNPWQMFEMPDLDDMWVSPAQSGVVVPLMTRQYRARWT